MFKLVIARSLALAAWSVTVAAFPLQGHHQLWQSSENVRRFDEVEDLIARNIYDPGLLSETWRSSRAHYRVAASNAQSISGLYFGVLTPRLRSLGQSHLTLTMPEGSVIDRNDPLIALGGIKLDGRGMNFCEHAGFDCFIAEGRLTVTGVDPSSNAAAAGVFPTAVVKSMRVNPNVGGESLVELLLESDGRDLPVRYNLVHAASEAYTTTLLANGVLLVRFDEFTEASVHGVLRSIQTMAPTGIVIDLRHNSGGSVRASNKFLSAFLEPGSSLGSISTVRGTITETVPQTSRPIFSGRMAVIIGPFSNSAAESAAAVLKDLDRAEIVGTRSAGNVLTSRTFTLRDGGKLRIPIEDYLSPSGVRLEGLGVQPTLETPPQRPGAEDSAVSAALNALDP